MTAEFIHAGKVHTFDVSAEPPKTITRSSRACPKSPVLRFTLALVRIDADRLVAIYTVTQSESE